MAEGNANPSKSMGKKRRRELSSEETELIDIYEDLANENEEIRLKAAHRLLQRHAELSPESLPKTKKVVHRLFRGLSSNRKAARLGFSVALTELLTQLSNSGTTESGWNAQDVIGILKQETVIEAQNSGQVCFAIRKTSSTLTNPRTIEMYSLDASLAPRQSSKRGSCSALIQIYRYGVNCFNSSKI